MTTTEPHPLLLFVGLFALLFIAGSLFAWSATLIGWGTGKLKLPPPEKRKMAPWGLVDIIVTVFLMIFMQFLFLGIAIGVGAESLEKLKKPSMPPEVHASLAGSQQEGNSNASSGEQESSSEPSESKDGGTEADGSTKPVEATRDIRSAAWLHSSGLAVMLLVTLWISLRCQVGWDRIGWSIQRLGRDFLLSTGSILLFVPIVYIVMAIVSQQFESKYDHPLFQMVGQNPWLLGFAVWMAVVVAPFTEEFFFRVLLQGYLESMACGPISLRAILFGRVSEPALVAGSGIGQWNEGWVSSSQGSFSSSRLSPSDVVVADVVVADLVHADPMVMDPASNVNKSLASANNPYQAPAFAPTIHDGTTMESSETQATIPVKLAWWPILVTALLFGLAHFEYGMSWLPLTLLGVVLGWLYRTTHRIWPSLLVHMFVNSVAMLALAAKILSEMK